MKVDYNHGKLTFTGFSWEPIASVIFLHNSLGTCRVSVVGSWFVRSKLSRSQSHRDSKSLVLNSFYSYRSTVHRVLRLRSLFSTQLGSDSKNGGSFSTPVSRNQSSTRVVLVSLLSSSYGFLIVSRIIVSYNFLYDPSVFIIVMLFLLLLVHKRSLVTK